MTDAPLARSLLIASLALALAVTTPARAQEDAQTPSSASALVDPERFDALLPKTLPSDWEKDNFSARTSSSENWGGAAYMSDGSFMQIELRHYTPAAWKQARAEAETEAAETVNLAGRTAFYDPTHRGMSMPVLAVFLENHFAARVVGPGEGTPEKLSAVLRQVPLSEVTALTAPSASPEAPSSSESGSSSVDPDALRPLLPETLADDLTLGAVGPDPRRPDGSVLRALYETPEGAPLVAIYVGYGGATQEMRAEIREMRASLRAITHAGHPFHLTQEGDGTRLMTIRDGMALMVFTEAYEREQWDADSGRRLLRVVDALDVEGMAELGNAPSARNAAGEAVATTPGETLRALLPDALAGMARGRIRTSQEQPVASVAYGKEGVPYTLSVQMATGNIARSFRGNIEKELSEPDTDLREVTRDGRTFYARSEESAESLMAFPGELVVMLAADAPSNGPFDAKAARERLIQAFDALGPDRLAAFTLPKSQAPGLDAPAGFTPYAADLDGVRIAFAHPDDWAAINLHRRSRFLKAVVAMRSAQAAEELFGDGLSISSEQKSRLVTPGNVIVSVAVVGKGMAPKPYLETMNRKATLSEPTAVQPPTETTLNGRAAFEAVVRGADADGRTVVQRRFAFTAGVQLIDVSILRPADAPPSTQEAVQVFLDHLTVTTP